MEWNGMAGDHAPGAILRISRFRYSLTTMGRGNRDSIESIGLLGAFVPCSSSVGKIAQRLDKGRRVLAGSTGHGHMLHAAYRNPRTFPACRTFSCCHAIGVDASGLCIQARPTGPAMVEINSFRGERGRKGRKGREGKGKEAKSGGGALGSNGPDGARPLEERSPDLSVHPPSQRKNFSFSREPVVRISVP